MKLCGAASLPSLALPGSDFGAASLRRRHPVILSASLLLSSLELSDTNVYEPYTRALLGTAAHFCQVVVLKLRTVPIGTAPSLRILPYFHRFDLMDRGKARAAVALSLQF